MKCNGCPVAEGPCFGESHPFACDMAARTDVERQWVTGASVGFTPAPPPPQPTLLQKAGSLAKAAVAYAKSGFANVSKAEFDRRHDICRACPKFDAEHDRCTLCGCSLAVKPWGRDMHCPDNPPRW